MSDDSDRFVYSTFGPSPGSESGPLITFLAAERGETGWISTPLSLPYSIYEKNETRFELMPIIPGAFSDDLHTAVWLSAVPLTPDGPPEKEVGLYRKTSGLAPEFIAKVGGGSVLFNGYSGFAGIAGDGSRIVFDTAEHLLPADAGRTSGKSIYAWDGGGLQLVDVDNGGNLLSTCGARISHANGMSSAARLVYFTVPAECGGVAEVYMRDLDSGTTVEVSASQCTRGDCNAPQDANFVGATSDGSVAFLTTAQQLTNADHDANSDLYRYDVGTGELTLLSGGSDEASGEVLQGTAFPSDDGSRVYFLANGQLLPSEPALGGEKLFRADSGGIHLVAEASFPSKPEVQLSANGTRALFVTQSQLLSGDTDSEPDVYLYDAGAESLTRLSTGPSGGNGAFPATISSPIERPEYQTTGDYQPFYAVDGSGQRAFFSTAEALVPEDVNGKVDVYEWWNGQLGLISSGQNEFDSGFGGVSRDGRSVLFVTNATLNPADVDGGNRDFYIARLEGGFPEPEEPQGCEVNLCPAPPRAPLARPTPGSISPQKTAGLRVISIKSKRAGVVGRKTTVLAAVPLPGLVSASVWIHAHGKKVVLATGRTHAAHAGQVRIDLQLTRPGREPLAARAQNGHLTVAEGDATISQTVKLSLGR